MITTSLAYINALCAAVVVGMFVSIFGLVIAILCDLRLLG